MQASISDKKNYTAVEILRIFAISAVIWFHTDGLPHRSVAFTGLVVFVLLASVFIGVSAKTDTFPEFLKKRYKRLVQPWAFWFVVYLTLNVVAGKTALKHSHDPVSTILAGPWIGLWYLPFIMLVSIAAYLIYRSLFHVPGDFVLFSALGFGLVFLALAETFRRTGFSIRPWAQWLHAAPAVPFAFAIHVLLVGKRTWWSVTAVCSTPLLYAVFTKFSDPGLVLTYSLAVPLATAAFLVPIEIPRTAAFLGSVVMGMYVVHGFLLSGMRYVLPNQSSPYLVYGLTLVTSAILAYSLKRVPVVRNMV